MRELIITRKVVQEEIGRLKNKSTGLGGNIPTMCVNISSTLSPKKMTHPLPKISNLLNSKLLGTDLTNNTLIAREESCVPTGGVKYLWTHN